MQRLPIYFSISFLLTLFISSCSSDPSLSPSVQTFDISSQFTGESYQLQVFRPAESSEDAELPVVYLLDGYYHFEDVKNMLERDLNDLEVMLVGIFYKDFPFSLSNLGPIEELREIDLTYPIHNSSSGAELGGGGLKFYDFLTKEVDSLIEENYKIDAAQRTLMGHSLGGYFTLWQMFNFVDSPFYHNVVSLSPALWWSDVNILKMHQSALQENKNHPFKLYVGIGTQEGIEANALVDEFAERQANSPVPALVSTFDRYEGGHLFSAKTGFQKALKNLFP
ncbi:MAG: alpha/beta hydrolase-fold protein [Bacteroidota bacterium]